MKGNAASPPPEEDERSAVRVLLFAACLCWLGLVAFNSLTRSQHFSPDSMVYVDVAQNVVQGRGLTQSVLLTYVPRDYAKLPLLQPFTIWPPLYPLMIAAFSWLGFTPAAAALLVPVLCCVPLLWCCHRLARRLYNPQVALLATSALTVFWPLRLAAGYAWSETLGLAALMAFFCCIAEARQPARGRVAWSALAGLFAGLAFATRYALLPAAALGLFCLADRRSPRRSMGRWAAFALGVALAAGPVLLHNAWTTGALLGPPRPPSQTSFLTNLEHAWTVVSRAYWAPRLLGPENQLRLFACLAVLLPGVAFLRRRFPALGSALFSGTRGLLPLWCGLYGLFIIVYRSRYHTDPIGPRLLAPALVPLALPLAAAAVTTFGPAPRFIRAAASALLLLALGMEVAVAVQTPARALDARIGESERLQWVRSHTTENDLIVGDSTMDLPLYCGFRHSICMIPGQDEAVQLRYNDLRDFLSQHRGVLDRVFIVIRPGIFDEEGFEDEWRRYFGPFITQLIYRHTEAYPGAVSYLRLRDAHVFEMDPDLME